MRESNKASSLKRKKELFLRMQKEKGIKTDERIVPRDRNGDIPVSFVQETALDSVRYYDPEETRVSCPYLGYIIKGKLNIPALNKTLHEIVRRHEILRTNYKAINKQYFQVINKVPEHIINVVDLKSLRKTEEKYETNRIISKRASDTFSFFQDIIMIRTLLIAGENNHMLYITVEHNATDGWSMEIMQKELLTLYEAFSKNKPSPLPELPIQFTDYAIWERERFSGGFLDEKLNYWKQVLEAKNTMLPTDYKPPAICFDGNIVPLFIGADLKRKLIILCQECEVTLFTTLLAAFAALIYGFSGGLYNFYSIPVSNRLRKETKPLIGCLMNFQYALIDLYGDPDYLEVIERTKNAMLNADDHYIPNTFIVSQMSIQDPLIDVHFQSFSKGMMNDLDSKFKDKETDSVSKHISINSVPKDMEVESVSKDIGFSSVSKEMGVESAPEDTVINSAPEETEVESAPEDTVINSAPEEMGVESASEDVKFIPHSVTHPVFALHDITLNLIEMFGQINGSLIYQTAVFNRSTIVTLGKNYINLLNSIVNNPKIRISEMNIKPYKL